VTVAHIRGSNDPEIAAANWLIWFIFLAELVFLVAIDPPPRRLRGRYVFNLLVIVLTFPLLPAALEFLRLARLVRLAPVLRLVGSVGLGARAFRTIFQRRGLLLVSALSVAAILIGGAVMTEFEPETVRGGYGSGVWWAIVTLTTVGYGDIAPVTPEGRVTAGILMLTGIGLISTLAAAVAAYFVGQDESPDLRRIEERLARIEDLLRATAERDSGGEGEPATRAAGSPE
jgi:voltage-gated potassium channel